MRLKRRCTAARPRLEKAELLALDGERSRKLEQRTREVAALNRMLQKHVRGRSAAAEAFGTVVDRLDRLAERAIARAEDKKPRRLWELFPPDGPDDTTRYEKRQSPRCSV